MILRLELRTKRKPGRYWFAWRPVRTCCGAIAWLEVVEVFRHYQIGDTERRKGGPWYEYKLVNEQAG